MRGVRSYGGCLTDKTRKLEDVFGQRIHVPKSN
jgi:hypothetical protein